MDETPRFVPAIAEFRCRAVDRSDPPYERQCPHAQADYSDLCLTHQTLERDGQTVDRVPLGFNRSKT